METRMLIRLVVFLFACLLWTTAQAAQPGGGPGGSTNYSCNGTNCKCDGSFVDCQRMEKFCVGNKVNCMSTTTCTCQMKPAPARPKPGQTRPAAPGTVIPQARPQ